MEYLFCFHRLFGSKDKRKTREPYCHFSYSCDCFSLLVTLILELCLPTILGALNTPAETYDMAYSYLTIYVLGYVAVYLYLLLYGCFKKFWKFHVSSDVMLVSTVLNAILDPILFTSSAFRVLRLQRYFHKLYVWFSWLYI